MANPTTTHVLEIETGIGEPAFIPLSMGHELQPISVGKKGMWRIESARVLDVHAFVYFDGTSLFAQSADESNPASVDGYRIGKAWTELRAPCKIEVGAARLRFRSLIADADNHPTMMSPGPPVHAPAGPGAPPPGASMPVAVAPAPPSFMADPQTQPRPQQSQQSLMQGAPPPANAAAPFAKPERPFRPGEFSSGPDRDESTRVAPLDATSAGRGPRPAAGEAPSADGSRPMMTGSGPMMQGGGGPPTMGMPGQHGMAPPGMGSQPGQGMPMQQPGMGYPPPQNHGGYPNAAGSSGAFNAMQPGLSYPGPQGMPQGPHGPSMPPGGYGSMTPQGGMAQPGPPQTPMQAFVAQLKANSIPKIIAGLLFIIGGILYLAEDEEPEVRPKKKISAKADAGPDARAADAGGIAVAASASSAPTAPTAPPVMTAAAPTWPPGVPCPPPNWPPDVPLPCTPNAAGSAPDNDPPEKSTKSASTSGRKTLEREAVDHVSAGETAKAAAAYEELVKRDPENKVYAEAARILRAKLDGGAGQ